MKLQHENIAKINCTTNESNECLNYVFNQLIDVIDVSEFGCCWVWYIKMVDDQNKNLTKLISYYQPKHK